MNDPFLQALSNPKQPTPGGGAAAAHSALVGLALLEKIVRVEHQRLQNDSETTLFWKALLVGLTASTDRFQRLRAEDGKSYMRLAETTSAGKGPGEVLEAVRQAIDCPLKIMENAHEALDLVLPAAKHCKRHLLPDLQVVTALLGAASRGACRIARANLPLLDDPSLTDDYQKKLAAGDDNARYVFKRVEDIIRERLKRQA